VLKLGGNRRQNIARTQDRLGRSFVNCYVVICDIVAHSFWAST
jgi:hypothetical protein